MTKPVDLIVSNELHDICESLEKSLRPEVLARAFNEDRAATIENVTRAMLCRLSHQANFSAVCNALDALGAPSGEQLVQRLQAVRDQRAEDGSAATFKANPIEGLLGSIAASLQEILQDAVGPETKVTVGAVKAGD